MKKKKLIIIIVISLIALAGLITGGVFLAQYIIRQNSPDFTTSDANYLIAHSPWAKLKDDTSSSDKLIWTFSEDGQGTITTNGGLDTYEMTWSVQGSTLRIQTKWLYDLTDVFSFTTDREQGTFTIVDTTEDKITTFVPMPPAVEESAEATVPDSAD